jgi:hypothetical protein
MVAIVDPRAITAAEAAVVGWLLLHAASEGIAGAAESVGELRVVGGCTCGCASIDFVADTAGARIVADAVVVLPDGRTGGAMLWALGNELAGLELYDHDAGASHAVPDVGQLRRWEDFRP